VSAAPAAVPFGLGIGLSLGTLGGGGSVLAAPILVYVLASRPAAPAVRPSMRPDSLSGVRVRRLGRATGAALCAGLVAVGAAAGAGSSLPLTQRVLAAGQFAGMRPSKPPVEVRSAIAFAQGNKTEEALLRRWGFVGAVSEQLVTPGNANRYGLSLVVQLSSPANAAAALIADYTAGGPWTRFAVPGIARAVGFAQLGPGDREGGTNVGFTVGPYTYLVGGGWQGGPKNMISNAAVIAAARLIDARVR
jgi:hypothetical protein